MELTNKKTSECKVTDAEVGRAKLGAFLIGNNIEVKGTELSADDAFRVLAGNIALLEQLNGVTDQGKTLIPELRTQAARTVRTGIEIFGLDQA